MPSHDVCSRAEERRRRLLAIEREQQLEELEALKITEEQMHLLKRSFSSVKFEFHDLDGQRWTQAALHTRQYRAQPSWHASPLMENMIPSSPKREKRDAASSFSDETIRTPARKKPRAPTLHSLLRIPAPSATCDQTPTPSPARETFVLQTPTSREVFTLPTPTPSPVREAFTFQAPTPSPAREPFASTIKCPPTRKPVKGVFHSVMRDLDMNTSWRVVDDSNTNDDTQLCPPTPVATSLGSFDDADFLNQPQFAFTASPL